MWWVIGVWKLFLQTILGDDLHKFLFRCSMDVWCVAVYFSAESETITDSLCDILQWNPSGKARKVSLKLQNLVNFNAPFFTNHVYFTPRDRPPLLKGHHFGWPL